MRRNETVSVDSAGRLFLMVLALCLFTVVYSLPAWAQDTKTCSDFDTQAEAQTALDNDSSLADELDPDNDDQACENFDFGDSGTGDDDGGASARAGNAEANAAGGALVDLTCEQLIRIGNEDGQYGEGRGAASVQYELRQRCEGRASADVIAGTIPNKTLADTGGASVAALMAGLIMAGGGLLLRASLRREP